ncbi:MAG: alpha/beta hydrolase, partial [Candidatus Binatia bacterium]
DVAGDGVVKYTSAHIEGVESEKVVRSGHSVQGNPEAIQEIKRILIENVKASKSSQKTSGLQP